jgi:hypothetical protein
MSGTLNDDLGLAPVVARAAMGDGLDTAMSALGGIRPRPPDSKS